MLRGVSAACGEVEEGSVTAGGGYGCICLTLYSALCSISSPDKMLYKQSASCIHREVPDARTLVLHQKIHLPVADPLFTKKKTHRMERCESKKCVM